MRYNGYGICTELYKNLLYKSKGCKYYYLDIPKPICDIEFAFLSDFIYGVNIGLSSFHFIPKKIELCPVLWDLNKTFDKLTIKDYNEVDYNLAELSYSIKIPHIKYYNISFNKTVHPKFLYEMDSIVLRSIFGKSYTNSVAIHSSGRCKIHKVDEFYRLKQWCENRKNNLDIPRESFLDRIQSLNALNKKLINV